MSDSLVELLRARVAVEGMDWLAQVLNPVASPAPASQPLVSPPPVLPGRAGRPVRRSQPPRRLSPSHSPVSRRRGGAGVVPALPTQARSGAVALSAPLPPVSVPERRLPLSAARRSGRVATPPVSSLLPRCSVSSVSVRHGAEMGGGQSRSVSEVGSGDEDVPLPPVVSVPTVQAPLAAAPMTALPGPRSEVDGASVLSSPPPPGSFTAPLAVLPTLPDPALGLLQPAGQVLPLHPVPGVSLGFSQPPDSLLALERGTRAQSRRSSSGSASRDYRRAHRRERSHYRHRRSHTRSAASRRSRRARRSRSSRWRSPSSSGTSSRGSRSSYSPDRRHRSRRASRRGSVAVPVPVTQSALPGSVADVPAVQSVEVPVAPAASPTTGEYAFAGAWGGADAVGPDLVGTLKALVDKLSSPPLPKPPPVQAGIYKDSLFCGVSPLGAHVADDVRQKNLGQRVRRRVVPGHGGSDYRG